MENNNITDNILDEIKKGDIKMKPKSYFVLQSVLFTAAMALVFLGIVYLVSFIIFSLRVNGAWFLPVLGFAGIILLLKSLPWMLVALCIFLIIVLEIFAEYLSFIYKRPMIYSLVALVVIILVAGFLVERTALHAQLLYKTQEGKLPFIKPLYQDYAAVGVRSVHNGIVQEVGENGFTMENPRGEVLQVEYVNAPSVAIEPSDVVIVVGDRNGNKVWAVQIYRVNEDRNMFPSQRHKANVK